MAPFVTFQVLPTNSIACPLSSSCPTEIRFLLRSRICRTFYSNQIDPLGSKTQHPRLLHQPNTPYQNHLFEFMSLPQPLVSRFREELDPKVSLTSLLRISSARTISCMSLNFSFSSLVELLTTILIASQLFGKEAKTISARIS